MWCWRHPPTRWFSTGQRGWSLRWGCSPTWLRTTWIITTPWRSTARPRGCSLTSAARRSSIWTMRRAGGMESGWSALFLPTRRIKQKRISPPETSACSPAMWSSRRSHWGRCPESICPSQAASPSTTLWPRCPPGCAWGWIWRRWPASCPVSTG